MVDAQAEIRLCFIAATIFTREFDVNSSVCLAFEIDMI